MKERLVAIVSRELDRLERLSQVGPLDMDEVKKLEVLTRSLKQLQDPPKKVDNPVEALTTEELLRLARGEFYDNQAQSRAAAKGTDGGGEEGGLG
jgi:hypothetical protein